MFILMFLLFGCPSQEASCYNDYSSYGPSSPVCWKYIPCSDSAWSLMHRPFVSCRPDQDSSIQWEPLNGSRVENEDRVGGVLLCTCQSTTR